MVTGKFDSGAGHSVAPDGSLLFGRGEGLHRLPLTTWRDGVPQFPIAEAGSETERIGTLAPDLIDSIGSRTTNVDAARFRVNHTFTDSDGNRYACYQFGPNQGHGWPTKWYGGRARLTKWDESGASRWSIGRQAIHRLRGKNDRGARPGTIQQPAHISGEARDAIFFTDRVKTPGMVYSKRGLYLGYVGDTRADDDLPRQVYDTGPSEGLFGGMMGGDSQMGGAVVDREDGLYWFAPESQASTVYRIHGWEDWTRLSRGLTVDTEPDGPAGDGTGLRGDYYTNPALSGEPAASRTDERVWFGVRKPNSVHDAVIDSHSLPKGNEWHDGPSVIDAATDFSVRWTGEVEAQVTEQFVFSTYSRGGTRLWIDDEPIIANWEEMKSRVESDPVWLEAGTRYPLRLEFQTTSDHPACSLNWESFSQERERIPPGYLYPNG
jgi:hypothetical protein